MDHMGAGARDSDVLRGAETATTIKTRAQEERWVYYAKLYELSRSLL
jgi:hypothetical protein